MEIYDPTCGSGGLLVKCEIAMEEKRRADIPVRQLQINDLQKANVQTPDFGWSRSVMLNQIKGQAYERAVKEKRRITANMPTASLGSTNC